MKKDDKEQNNIKQENKVYLKETNSVISIRFRTFSDWPHSSPSSEMMPSYDWFSSYVSDRVIWIYCIYCNQTCHNWIKYDDPFFVSMEFSPECPFII